MNIVPCFFTLPLTPLRALLQQFAVCSAFLWDVVVVVVVSFFFCFFFNCEYEGDCNHVQQHVHVDSHQVCQCWKNIVKKNKQKNHSSAKVCTGSHAVLLIASWLGCISVCVCVCVCVLLNKFSMMQCLVSSICGCALLFLLVFMQLFKCFHRTGI